MLKSVNYVRQSIKCLLRLMFLVYVSDNMEKIPTEIDV